MKIVVFILLLVSLRVNAHYGQVEILQISSSGKTIVLNIGPDNKIDTSDYGILLLQDIDPSDKVNKKQILRPVAKIKSIKLLQDSSIWVVFETFIASKMRKNSKLLLISQNELLTGRSKLKIKRSKFIGSNNIKNELKETLLEEGQSLAKKSDNYEVVSDIHDKEVISEEDVNLLDLEKWEDLSGTGKKSTISIYKSAHAKKFADRKRLDTFEKMVYGMLQRYNDPRYSHAKHYQEQKRTDGMIEVQERMLGVNSYDKYKNEIANKNAKQEKFYSDLLKKGESWSDDYSNEELSELLHNVSIINEKERREDIFAYKYNYQLYLSFGFNLLDNQILSDAENGEDKKYEFEIAAESYFFKKLEGLNRFSLELSLRRSQDGVSIGQSNAILIDYSGALQANWYPFQTPNTLQKNIFYLGLLFRSGVASLLDRPSGEVASYQSFSFPGLRLGLKYNFASTLGIRLSASYENIQLDRIEKSNSAGVLPNRQNLTEGKLSIGLSKLF